jgi:CRISPR-associated endonuclease/helicase Cas3
MRIATSPVYSRLADENEVKAEQQLVERCPAGLRLSQHQLLTYRALKDPATDVVINTATTGDGKSMAGLLPILGDRRETMALYPTNELIQDQLISARKVLGEWGRPERWVTDLFGARLDEKVHELQGLRRGDAILTLYDQHKLILSNPDIFHYVMQFCYKQPGTAPDWLAGRIGTSFRQLTFDEFHIFDVPQIAAVLTGLLFIYEQRGDLKTLFLSATPGGPLREMLDRAGLRTRVVPLEGCYHHGADPGDGWRLIQHGLSMTFDEQRAEDWVATHIDDIILPYFLEHRPGAKGAIITGSVAAAKRIVDKLRPHFERNGLRVEENTGLTGRDARRASYDADLLVGTSTIDIGVDFQINFLVFEASDAGNFLQRLGRVGRHAGFVRDGVFVPFEQFVAYALVPPFVNARISQGHEGAPPLLQVDQALTRDELRQTITDAFPPPTTFRNYLKHWGCFQPAEVVARLQEKTIRENYTVLIRRLHPRYEQTFDIRFSNVWREGKRIVMERHKLLIEEAGSFRGGSPFSCGVLVAGDEPLTYDLFWLLANARLELLDEQQFMSGAAGHPTAAEAIRRNKPAAYFRLMDYYHERHDVFVQLPTSILDWGMERYDSAQVFSGVKVVCSGVDWLNELNRHISARKVVGLVVKYKHPSELRRSFRLPSHFHLHAYQAINGESGTIAFARQALILDTALRYRRLSGSDNSAIVL